MRGILATALIGGIAVFSSAWSQNCAFTIEAGDQMQYLQREITVSKSCDAFELTLKHIGTLPATIMGHNWVLTKTKDYQSVGQVAQSLGPDNDYVPPKDPRVLAHTRIVGGGEETTISFDPSELAPGGDYTYFCTFPGHFLQMNGKLIVE
jgi:azurin